MQSVVLGSKCKFSSRADFSCLDRRDQSTGSVRCELRWSAPGFATVPKNVGLLKLTEP